MHLWVKAVVVAGLVMATPAVAQDGSAIAFGGLKTDTTQPVQVTSDQLAISQADGTAVFTGNVVIVQGAMKLQAAKVQVNYSADKKAIQNLHAEGGVTLTTGTDAATSDSADYSPDSGELILQGSVVLTQGPAALSGQKLILNLASGLGTMSGRVTTIFTPGQN
ncbi:MAG: lipopolysaccharide transport periplasmic protein LptA [Candidatus Saccharibacteria bacterium]|nr:lipopolysaccharide transport periplasmic protein LptA [Pseudorhodobacter sp.]